VQTVQENVYDGRNYRVVRKDFTNGVVSETRHFYYSESWQSLEERLDSETEPDRQHVWGLRYVDDLVLRSDWPFGSEVRKFALQDANWNVTAIVDELYDVVERYAYTAYGEPTVLDSGFVPRSASSYGWDVLYAGYRRDEASGLYVVRNRWLHPVVGCWNRRDPQHTQDASEPYEYAGSNPSVRTDPIGLEWIWNWDWSGFGAGYVNSLNPWSANAQPPVDTVDRCLRGAQKGAIVVAGVSGGAAVGLKVGAAAGLTKVGTVALAQAPRQAVAEAYFWMAGAGLIGPKIGDGKPLTEINKVQSFPIAPFFKGASQLNNGANLQPYFQVRYPCPPSLN
jgi:RHS repeat-associated protein